MKRRANHEGTIRQRVNGTWEAQYRHRGRRHSIYGKDHADVVARLRVALGGADNGIAPPPGRLTTGAWLERWVDEHVAPYRRPRTVQSYRDTVNLYIKPRIGHVPLARLSPDDVAGMLAHLSKAGRLSSTTQRYALVILRIALGRALKLGLIPRNPAAMVDAPSKGRPDLHPLTADQARAFLEATQEDRLGPVYAVAVGLGLRQGEILALRWSDLDLDKRIVQVRHTLHIERKREKGQPRQWRLAEPKTARGRRSQDLPVKVVAAFREQRVRQARERLAAGQKWEDHDVVFTTPQGRPLDGVYVTHTFQKALDAAGLPPQRFHDLRHAFATLLIEKGVELTVISRALGHANLSTTADVYGSWTREMAGTVASRMDEVLAG